MLRNNIATIKRQIMNFNFPALPPAKKYGNMTTPEQDVIMKLVQLQKINKQEEATLIEAIEFYERAFAYLKSIDLALVDDNDGEEIISFFKSVINMHIITQNKINFHNVFRVTTVKEAFLENGKVRDVSFISYPPLEIVEQLGVYGRCNSPTSTVFYCAFEPGVAVLETKPKVGQRIIIAQWHNDKAKDFISYPITNNRTIDNESLKAATKAFQDRMHYNHPLFAKILDLYFDFLSSEFVKDIEIKNPKKYEYLFSAFFSDWILENRFKPHDHPVEPIKHYDCVIYPSISINYRSDNLSIIPTSVSKLRPILLEDCIVVKTMYENPDLINDKLPIVRKVLRRSIKIKNNKIFWSDD